MKKFLFRSLGFACFFLLVLSLVVIFLGWHGKTIHVYLDEYGHKESMLKNTPAPRVIFIGGSNLAFGIDGKMVEDSIGVNSVNYGIQAGVGLRLMMEDAMEYSRQGDILVISPEYEHFYGNYHGEKSTLSILTLLYPHIIKRFDAGNYAEMGRGFGDALSVLAMSYFPGDSGNGTSLYKYSSLSFNEYGDESRHWTYPAESITLDRNYIVGEFDESAFDKFLECISLLEDRGVEILIIPPSVYGGFYDRYHNEIDTVDRRLAAEGHPFAIKPEAAVFERDEMFDSDYHLSRKGIDRRMEQIIDALRKVRVRIAVQ